MPDLRDRIASILDASFLRFFGASLLGLVFDVALASVLHHVAGLPIIASAAVSLIVAGVLMYFVHEFWTFRARASVLSFARMSGTVVSALAVVAIRTACLYTTTQVIGLGESFAVGQILFATGLSFVLNYVLVRRIIGGRSEPGPAGRA